MTGGKGRMLDRRHNSKVSGTASKTLQCLELWLGMSTLDEQLHAGLSSFDKKEIERVEEAGGVVGERRNIPTPYSRGPSSLRIFENEHRRRCSFRTGKVARATPYRVELQNQRTLCKGSDKRQILACQDEPIS
jgi:hypothetical protein